MNFHPLTTNRKGLFNIGQTPKLDLSLNKCWYINALNDAYKNGLVPFLNLKKNMIDDSCLLSVKEYNFFQNVIDYHMNLRFRIQKCITKWKNLKRKRLNNIINEKDLFLQTFIASNANSTILIFDTKGYFQFHPNELIKLYLTSIHQAYKMAANRCVVKNPYTMTDFKIPHHYYIYNELRLKGIQIPSLLIEFYSNCHNFEYFVAKNCYSLEEKFRYDFYNLASKYTFLDLVYNFLTKYYSWQKISRYKVFQLDFMKIRKDLIHLMVHEHMQSFINPSYRMHTYEQINIAVANFIFENKLLNS